MHPLKEEQFKPPRVDYHIKLKDRITEKHLRRACFSQLALIARNDGENQAVTVKYRTIINKTLTNKEILFFIGFIKKIIGTKEAFTFKRRKLNIIFYVKNVFNDNGIRIFFLLTGLRYLTENPEIIKECYKYYESLENKKTEEAFEKLFDYFQRMHYCQSFSLEPIGYGIYNNIGGHTLVFDRKWFTNGYKAEKGSEKDIKTISFKSFTEKFKNTKTKITGVQAFFR
jgi:hypothetical protein